MLGKAEQRSTWGNKLISPLVDNDDDEQEEVEMKRSSLQQEQSAMRKRGHTMSTYSELHRVTTAHTCVRIYLCIAHSCRCFLIALAFKTTRDIT